MTVGFMKWVDTYIGTPLCLLAYLMRLVMRALVPSSGREPKHAPREILLVKFWGMGSILLAAQAWKDLRDTYCEAHFTVLTFPSNRDVIAYLGCFDEIMTVRRSSLFLFCKDLLSVRRLLATRSFDLAMDCEFSTRFTALLVGLSRSPARVGFTFAGRVRNLLFTHRVPFDKTKHVTENFVALSRCAGANPSSPWQPGLFSDEVMDRARTLMALPGERDKTPVICVNANAGELSYERRWPADRFTDLCRLLIDRGAHVILLGAGQDVTHVDRIAASLPADDHLVNCAGKTTFNELGALLSLSDLLISSDSGPVHLAWALSIPTVSIFGPETPVLYGPLSGHNRILYTDLPCSPCIDAAKIKIPPRCKLDGACVKGISVQAVLDAAEALLREASRPELSSGSRQQ